jgi:LmbE family N-acetylglucosaminyl deacetylase
MQSVDTLGKVMVISPHLDDGVFSCGELIGAVHGAVVVTIFAGVPPASGAVPEWDRAAGFESVQQALATRRLEDRRALELLNAVPQWLDFCDSQYGAPASDAAIAAALDSALHRHGPDTVMIPGGLFHSDHLLAHQAALRVRQHDAERSWFIYEDALYRRIAGLLQQRLASLLDAGIWATPVAFSTAVGRARKRRAILSYGSQLRALGTPGKPGSLDLDAPERYWRLGQDRPTRE